MRPKYLYIFLRFWIVVFPIDIPNVQFFNTPLYSRVFLLVFANGLLLEVSQIYLFD